MSSIQLIKGSDGTGNANIATVQTLRSPGSTTIVVDTVLGINAAGFAGTMGTPHTFTDPITSETITVISEATAVDFTGHVTSGHLEIDTIAPGYVDAGSAVGDIIVVRPTTQYANNLAETLEVSLSDNGTLNAAALGQVYPIGSIYTSTVATNPATLLGFGTWVAFGAGRVLVGKNTSGTFGTAGATGGEETHTLTTPEIPSHSHTERVATGSGSATGITGTAALPTGSVAIPQTTDVTGGGGAHNNLQPYIVVYMWNRTA